MRSYGIITIGLILEELRKETKSKKILSRGTYRNLEKELNLNRGTRNSKGWQTYTKFQKTIIKRKIKKYFVMY